jgi:hypothetical protein
LFSALLIICGCSRDSFSKNLICKNLALPYSAKADVIVSGKDTSRSGTVDISKADIVKMTFCDSSDFSGITVTGDNTGKSDVYSFEFSGIPASVPKSLTSEISLLFSLFSDEIPVKIETLPKDSFRALADSDKDGNSLFEVFFTENGYDYHITYDKNKGYPKSMSIGNDALSVSITFKEFKQTKI